MITFTRRSNHLRLLLLLILILIPCVNCHNHLGYSIALPDNSRADFVGLHNADARFANNSCAPITHLYSCDDVGTVKLAHARVSRAANDAPAVFVAAVIDTMRPALVPHFIKHYRDLGVRADHFVLVVHMNKSDDARQVTAFLSDANIPFVEWWGPFTTGVKLFHLLHALSITRANDFVVWADLDEFHEFAPFLPSLDHRSVANLFRANRCNSLQGRLVDRVALNGDLPQFQPDIDIQQQFPLRCNLTTNLVYGDPRKTVLTPASLITDGGHHAVPLLLYFLERGTTYLLPNQAMQNHTSRVCGGMMQTSHFKWSAGVFDYLIQRSQVFREKKIPWWMESQRVVDRASKRQSIAKFCKGGGVGGGKWIPLNRIEPQTHRKPQPQRQKQQQQRFESDAGNK
jgi:hypothetical protein